LKEKSGFYTPTKAGVIDIEALGAAKFLFHLLTKSLQGFNSLHT